MHTLGRIAKVILPVSLIVLPCLAQAPKDPSELESHDRIVFRNGDVLSGWVSGIGAESVRFSSSVLGEVCITRASIAKIETNSRVILLIATDPSDRTITPPRNDQVDCREQALSVEPESHRPRRPFAATPLLDTLAVKEQALPTTTPRPPKNSATPDTLWFFNINAPASVVFGTTSQETYGGQMDLELYEGKVNHSKMWAGGSYNRSWQVGSPSIFTDVFDAYFQQSRSLGADRGGLYGRAEWFLNTALGLALQQSLAAGYYSHDKKIGVLQFLWLADLRYSRERLYSTAPNLNLIGSRLEGQLTYRKKDAADASKTKYSVIARTWVNPMWNKPDALQAFSTVQLSLPIGHSICLSFNPVEDDYMRNAPAGKKTNYITSSVSLQVKRTYDPKQGCY